MRYLPRHDPFLEMASIPRTVVAIGGKNFSLYKKFKLGRSLVDVDILHQSENISDLFTDLRKGDDVVVSIAMERCFSRSLKLPLNALPKIDQILDLDVSRVTPFAREHVFSGWINHGSPTETSPLNVEHILIQKNFVTETFDTLRRSGIRPTGLTVHDASGISKPLALSIDGSPFGSVLLRRWQKMTGFGLVALILASLAFTILVFARQSHVSSDILKQSQEAGKRVGEVRNRLDLIKINSAEVIALQKRKNLNPSRLEIIEELSRILPNEAFLGALAIDTNRVNIDGEAQSPEQLIASLESSPTFQNVAFSSPVFKNLGDSKSHFSIRFELEAFAVEKPN